jgi:DNA-binding transcriptional regulator LsrR (DeoR family)
MNYDEIVKAARSESDAAVTFNMRKFPDAQGEAIETYLQATGMGAQMGVLRHTKPIVIVCDAKAAISPRAEQLLAALKSKGVDVEIQRQD